MPYAYVTSTGVIRTTCLKPVEVLQAGEALVKYILPDYDPELVAPLIKAVQELSARIVVLESDNKNV